MIDLFTDGSDVIEEGKRYGVDIAVVTKTNDPENLNRIKCKRIMAEEDEGETDWMYVVSPMAGKNHGIMMMPDVNDKVLISYMGGDIHRPFALGFIWDGETKPPYKVGKDNENTNFSIKLESGSEIHFYNKKSEEKIKITTPKGSALEIDDKKQEVVLKDKAAKNSVKIDISKDEIVINADKKISLNAGGKAKIELDGKSGNITLNANQNVNIKAANVKSKTTAETSLKSGGKASVAASGVTEIKGSLVKIN